MNFLTIYFIALAGIVFMMTILWLVSIKLHNVSIVDLFWGLGFAVTGIFYFLVSDNGFGPRKTMTLILVCIWGIRLSVYLTWRNSGKGEDIRYQNFRKNYGEHRYWWISFFQTFLLQGVLMWIISAPLLGASFSSEHSGFSFLDYAGLFFSVFGIVFETTGDLQLTGFKQNPENRGKVMRSGLWKYTRHPNYFGDSLVWWGFGLISAAAGVYWPLISSAIMTFLLLKVSGVAMLDKTMVSRKPSYQDYIDTTSGFFPWFPKTKKK